MNEAKQQITPKYVVQIPIEELGTYFTPDTLERRFVDGGVQTRPGTAGSFMSPAPKQTVVDVDKDDHDGDGDRSTTIASSYLDKDSHWSVFPMVSRGILVNLHNILFLTSRTSTRNLAEVDGVDGGKLAIISGTIT